MGLLGDKFDEDAFRAATAASNGDKPPPFEKTEAGSKAVDKHDDRATPAFLARMRRAVQRRELREGAAPKLTSGAELVAKRQGKLDAMAEAARRWGWDENLRLRLLDYDPDAQDARDEIGLEVFGTSLSWPQQTRDELLDMFAEGRSADDDVMTLSGEIVVPELLPIEGVPLYEGLFHLEYGPKGSFKTAMLIYRMCRLAEMGAHSILWEYEMARGLMQQLIEDLGFDRDEMEKYVHVIAPEEPLSTGSVLRNLARFPEAKLLGLDNVTEVITLMPDAHENAAQDVSRVLRVFRNLAHKRDLTAVALDHTGHDGGHARGSSVKGQITDIEAEYEPVTPVTRKQQGSIKVLWHKDRGTQLGVGAVRHYQLGDGKGKLPISDGKATATSTPGVWSSRQQKFRDAVRSFDGWVSTKAAFDKAGIAPGGRGRPALMSEVLALASDPLALLEMESSTTANGTTHYKWRFAIGADAEAQQRRDERSSWSAGEWEGEILRAAGTGELVAEGKRGVAAVLGASPDSETFSEAWDLLAGREAISFEEESGRYVAPRAAAPVETEQEDEFNDAAI